MEEYSFFSNEMQTHQRSLQTAKSFHKYALLQIFAAQLFPSLEPQAVIVDDVGGYLAGNSLCMF